MDRAASVWLVRRFIDRAAEIRLIDALPRGPSGSEHVWYIERPRRGSCAFSSLLGMRRALERIARVVRSVVCNTRRREREAAGLAAIFDGLACHDEELLLERASVVYDALYASFVPKPPKPLPRCSTTELQPCDQRTATRRSYATVIVHTRRRTVFR